MTDGKQTSLPAIDLADPQVRREIAFVVRRFMWERGKENYIESNPNQASTVGAAVLLVSCASRSEVEAAFEDPEFLHALDLARRAKQANADLPELENLRRRRVEVEVEQLRTELHSVEEHLLGKRARHIHALRDKDEDKAEAVRTTILDHQARTQRGAAAGRRRALLRDAIACREQGSTPLVPQSVLAGSLVDEDICAYYAYYVTYPWASDARAIERDPDWERCPLKWLISNMEVPEATALFAAYKGSEDLVDYFIARYGNGATQFAEQNEYLANLTALVSRRDVVLEAFRAHDQGLWTASLCTSLPLAEGLLWDLARMAHGKHGDVAPDPELPPWRILEVLKSSRMGKVLDGDFLDYFAVDLYPGRHPVLHGRSRSPATNYESARALAVVEYLVERLGEWNLNAAFENLRDLPPETLAKLDAALGLAES